MKTKVISSSLLMEFQEKSYDKRAKELREAAKPLASKLGVDGLNLFSFNETTALYQAPKGHIIRVGYLIKENEIVFKELLDLVVDDESLEEQRKKSVSKLLESLTKEDKDSAADALKQYLQHKITLKESAMESLIPPTTQPEWIPTKEDKEINEVRSFIKETLGDSAIFDVESVVGRIAKNLHLECQVLGYPGTSMKEKKDDEVELITIPTVDTEKMTRHVSNKVKKIVEHIESERVKALELHKESKFETLVKRIKSLNATGEVAQIGESMSELVTGNPHVLYLSIPELADQVKSVFENAGSENWDEELCFDIAEGAQKLAGKVYPKISERIQEASDHLWDDSDELSENAWDNYKLKTGKMFKKINEAEEKLRTAGKDLIDIIEHINPLLREIAYREQNPMVTAVARNLSRFSEHLKTPSLQIIAETLKFLNDYVTKEAWQLEDDGVVPGEAKPSGKIDTDKCPEGIPYRNYPKGDKGPYASTKPGGEVLKEAWQLNDDGSAPAEVSPKTPKSDWDKDFENKPYDVTKPNQTGYMKAADENPVKGELPVEEFDDVKDMDELVVPLYKLEDDKFAQKKEALQVCDEKGDIINDEGKKELGFPHDQNKGTPEKDPTGKPYMVATEKPFGFSDLIVKE